MLSLKSVYHNVEKVESKSSHCSALPQSCYSTPKGRVMVWWMVSPKFYPRASLPLCGLPSVPFSWHCWSLSLHFFSFFLSIHLYAHIQNMNISSFGKSKHWETKLKSLWPTPNHPYSSHCCVMYCCISVQTSACAFMCLYLYRELYDPSS